MNLFALTPSAEYFCRPFSAPPATPAQSVKSLVRSYVGVTHLHEGDARFDDYRLALLTSVERWLFYSLVHYRRALEMMTPGSAAWAHVTLYYSSFYAANAILGMFGGWVGSLHQTTMVDVVTQGAGTQEFLITRKATPPGPASGSHGVFWAFFYGAAPQISPWAPAALTSALSAPVSTDWQTVTRNEVNYDMFGAFEASRHFKTSFNAATFPASVTGNLGQQLDITEKMLELGLTFARHLSLECFGLDGLSISSGRNRSQRRLARMTSPRVLSKSAFARLLST
jgi:hypothetical protein